MVSCWSQLGSEHLGLVDPLSGTTYNHFGEFSKLSLQNYISLCISSVISHTNPQHIQQAFGSPAGATHRCLNMPKRLDPQSGATHRCLESQPGLHTGVWIPNQGYTHVFGSPTGATHMGIWIYNLGYTRVFRIPKGR